MLMTLRTLLNGSHAETEALMSAFVDNEVRGLARWRVMRHLKSCEGCRAMYEAVLKTLTSLRSLGRSEPPGEPHFADRVIERIHQGERRE